MKLIIAAFWVHDDDVREAMMVSTRAIKGSGAIVSVAEDVAGLADFKHVLRRLNLAEAADFDPEGWS